MKKQDLILTSTVGMERQEWLEFRQPIFHIKNFIIEHFKQAVSKDPSLNGNLFHSNERFYSFLKNLFTSNEWKEFIFPCLGASEVASILGLNPYKSSIELYFEKTGAKETWDIDNVAMFWGRELEEQIAEKWRYWDGSPEGMINNFKEKNKIRGCRRLNAYVQNKATPWLFVSLDRVINKQELSEEEVLEEGSLECKTISGFAANMWEGGIPIMYVAQLQAQLIACGFEFGEIAILKDGRYFEVYPFDRHAELCERIIRDTKEFFDIVKIGAAEFLLHTYATNDGDRQDHYAALDRIAPEPDGSEAYKNYLSEKYQRATTEGVIGGVVEVELARNYKYYAARQKEYDVLQTECSNKLKNFMKEAAKLDLGTEGSCTWNENGKGSRTFRVNVKLPEGYKPGEIPTEEKTVAPVKEKKPAQNKALEARMKDMSNLGLKFDVAQNAFVLNDFNVPMLDIQTKDEGEYSKMLLDITGEMERRKPKDVPFENDTTTKRAKKPVKKKSE